MVEELIISVRSIQTILNLVKIITNILLSCDSVACIYLFLILINVWCLCLTNNALTICWWTWVNIGLISILTDAWVTEQLLGADSTETPVTPPTSTVEKPPSSTSSAEATSTSTSTSSAEIPPTYSATPSISHCK